MTEDMLARRAVACRGFRWVRGMLRHDGYRYIGSGVWARWSDTAAVVTALHMPEQYPDLTDPATVGCLLALVREAWGDPGFYVTRSGIYIGGTDILGWDSFGLLRGTGWGTLYRSEVDALVAALEAAP